MRKAAIDISKLPDELLALAGEQIGAALAAGEKILCFGHPASAADIKPNNPTASLSVLATCTECTTPIYSTELKEAILHLAPEMVHICCLPCFYALAKDIGAGSRISVVLKPESE